VKPKSTRLQVLLETEVTRKQFLQVLGVLIISVLGFHNLFNVIHRYTRPAGSGNTSDVKRGFGASKFGV
jgi:hypothetical protein